MSKEALRFREAVLYSVGFIMLLWFIKAIEIATSMHLGFLGILPRTLIGTVGILTGPLIHGDLMHLLSNSFPLLMLGIGVIYFYHNIALEVLGWIYFLTGISVWMLAREHYHIGASGIVYGLVAFLFFSGIIRKDSKSVAISLIIIFMYSGMIMGIFPLNQGISWESHLMGSLAGIFCAIYFRGAKISEDQDVNTGMEILTPEEVAEDGITANVSIYKHDTVKYTYTYLEKEAVKNEEQLPMQKKIIAYKVSLPENPTDPTN